MDVECIPRDFFVCPHTNKEVVLDDSVDAPNVLNQYLAGPLHHGPLVIHGNLEALVLPCLE